MPNCLDNSLIHRRRIDTFWSKGINKFWSRGIGTGWAQKFLQEKDFELYCAELPILHTTYILPKLLTT